MVWKKRKLKKPYKFKGAFAKRGKFKYPDKSGFWWKTKKARNKSNQDYF
ncbi:MAG: hypothetical protein KAI16_02560 [Candidatus Pacebacteria bacterium]|nr:hypothetical protein [Candidatus Paceibacterota bacterium]